MPGAFRSRTQGDVGLHVMYLDLAEGPAKPGRCSSMIARNGASAFQLAEDAEPAEPGAVDQQVRRGHVQLVAAVNAGLRGLVTRSNCSRIQLR